MKDVHFQWTDNHEKDFKDLENSIMNGARLQYFNPCKPLILQVEACKRGLEAVPVQKDTEGKHAIDAYASKSLAPAETRYGDIEQEILTIMAIQASPRCS